MFVRIKFAAMNSEKKNRPAVTIIGLGPMGQAMGHAYLEKEYSLTVWNRTPGKADALVARGATRAATVGDALNASELAVISLTDYDIMYTILESAQASLPGKTLVNMSSDTPEKLRQAEQWANRYGAAFLAGGIMVPPPMVGQESPHVYTFYSGDEATFKRHQAALQVMSATDYRGRDVGLAMVYYQALLDFMYTAVAGGVHAYALAKSAGIDAKIFEPYFQSFLQFLPDLFASSNTAAELDSGRYDGSQNNMRMLAAGTGHVLHASRDAGIDVSLPEVVDRIYAGTAAQGFAEAGINSIVEVLKQPARPGN